MITKTAKKGSQIEIVSLDMLVPEDHLLRKIDEHIDFSFIYDLVEEKYSLDNGRPSIDPVTLIKIPIIQYMFGIKSMRQTIKEIEVNVAYRWFLGLDFYDQVPHFSTFGKNYKRRFEGTDLFEQIFSKILLQCMQAGLVDTETIFVDSTHVKAAANRKKMKKVRSGLARIRASPVIVVTNIYFIIIIFQGAIALHSYTMVSSSGVIIRVWFISTLIGWI